MQKINDIVPEQFNTAVALGFFDGLHIGHRKVLAQVVEQKQNGLVSLCFTFAQSPKSILRGTSESALVSENDKLKILDEIGIEHTVCADFRAIMNMSAEEFVSEILAKQLRAKFAACGFNYRFGKNGEGDSETLKRLCTEHGIEVVVVPPKISEGEVVSSTLIRGLIGEGKVRRANELLGSEFGFCSTIEHGKRLGRQLGTPTINQPLCHELVVPRFGVYASAVTLENGDVYCGVTNIGVKPTVGKFAPLCETWMPDYKGGEIYGETADIRLLDFVREEKKFDNIDMLKTAILENAKTAKIIFDEIITGS